VYLGRYESDSISWVQRLITTFYHLSTSGQEDNVIYVSVENPLRYSKASCFSGTKEDVYIYTGLYFSYRKVNSI
jgi:hypothetical protein